MNRGIELGPLLAEEHGVAALFEDMGQAPLFSPSSTDTVVLWNTVYLNDAVQDLLCTVLPATRSLASPGTGG